MLIQLFKKRKTYKLASFNKKKKRTYIYCHADAQIRSQKKKKLKTVETGGTAKKNKIKKKWNKRGRRQKKKTGLNQPQ